MDLSELQLVHYCFNEVRVAANKAFDDEQLSGQSGPYHTPAADGLTVKVSVGEPSDPDEDTPPFFTVDMALAYDEACFPYQFKISASGIFECETNFTDCEQRHQYQLVVNAASLLYSALREHLLTLTTRQRFGPVMLPSLDLRTLSPRD